LRLCRKYLKYSIDAFLISEARRYEVKGKRYFEYPNKYYYSDIRLRNVRLNYRQIDSGHILENMIYNELIRRGYSVDVGVVKDRSTENKKMKELAFLLNQVELF